MHRRGKTLVLLTILSPGCREPQAPAAGAIVAAVSTHGEFLDRDADGYVIRVDDQQAQRVAIDGQVKVGALNEGVYAVKLDGLAPNCSVAGANPITVQVTDDAMSADPVVVSFVVSCVPHIGNLLVTTVTAGSDPDQDGFDLVVGGVSRGSIPANGTRTISGVRAGSIGVTLAGLAGNCSVEGAFLKSATVNFGATTQIAFAIQCVQSGGVRVTTTTTGDDPAGAGYELELRVYGTTTSTRLSAPPNGTVTFNSMRPGTYLLSLVDLVPDCDPVTPGPITVNVTGGTTTDVTVQVACATPGRLAFVSEQNGNPEIYTISTSGTGMTRLTSHAAPDVSPAWSPDGTRIAFASSRDFNFEIYVVNADGQGLARLTDVAAADRTPAWSPDGTRIAFTSERDGNAEIYVMRADGGDPVRLTNNQASDIDPAWSPDGSRIVFTSTRGGGSGIYVMKADGSDVTRLSPANSTDSQPAWSPDGLRIAFSVGSPPFAQAIYLMNADGSARTALSRNLEEASNPVWSPDGRKIVFTVIQCDFYRYYCEPSLEFVGVTGAQYSRVMPGRMSEVSWHR